MDPRMKRCWAEIDLDRLEHNYHELRRPLPAGCRFLGVVKANAYGHGAVAVARRLEALGADYLAVAFLDEAVELREAGVRLPILLLGYTDPAYTGELLRCELTQAVTTLEAGRAYSAVAASLGGRLRCHLKLDSGMGRVGFRLPEQLDEAAAVLREPGLDFEGVFTHFAVSDVPGGEAYTHGQHERFLSAVRELEARRGEGFAIVHCANSGAVLSYRQFAHDMVRPGIMLYGCYPDKDRGDLDLKQVMSFKTRVVQLKELPAGESVSYGRLWKAEGPRRVAVLSVGYADGLNRLLSGRMDFLIRGKKVPQVGRICMDMCMADVTDLPAVAVGDEAVIFGQGEGGEIPVEALSDTLGTISYEVFCNVAARVPRVFTSSGKAE